MIKTYVGRKLSRTSQHRRMMLANMATSLFLHEKIRTTTPKAKELKIFAERIIGRVRRGQRREVRRVIHDRAVYSKLFKVLGPRYEDRAGGYVQLFRLDRRAGDNTELSLVKLVT